MQAIVQHHYGTEPERVLQLEELAKPALGDDEVLVRVAAASVDMGTWHCMTGMPYAMRLAGFGVRSPKASNPGRAFAGTVDSVGREVTEFKPNDEVYGTCDGSFAECARVETSKLATKPANLSFELAAAVPVSGGTALQAVRKANVQPGQKVLIVGASGGVGSFAVQIAKTFGAEVTGVCSTAKVDLVRALGADHVIDYTADDFATGEFRYDVILYVKPQEQPRLAMTWLDWSKENLTLSSVRELLLSREPRTLGIARVPNARVLPEYRAAASLARGDKFETTRVLRDAIETMRVRAFHPETFWALQDDLPYWVDLTWSHAGGPECFDVLLQRRDRSIGQRPPASFEKEQFSVKPWHVYAHNPTEAKRNRVLGSELRAHLKKKLPDYMVPSAFVFLDSLPLTPNGKLDRKRLPAPDHSRPEIVDAFAAPRTPIEEILANIWAEVLKLDQVGIHDNFFELGGHSLLATQVVSRIRSKFAVDLPLRNIFEAPTIAALAPRVQPQGEKDEDVRKQSIARVEREAYKE
jgi:acyl carrier protein